MTLDLRLYLVTDPAYADLDRIAPAAVSGGVTCVQVRDKQGAPTDRTSAARRLRALLPDHITVIANDDVESAHACDGLHVGLDDIPPSRARALLGPDAVIGWSINDLAQLDDEDELAACDYVAASPVWTTPTKADATRPFGIDGVRALSERLARRLPLVAIGGIDAGNARPLIEAGADGIAVVSAIGGADDPQVAARQLRAVVDDALAGRQVST